MISHARNGGSITPRYRKILDAHVASGKISLHTHTQLQSVSWSASSSTWACVTSTPESQLPSIDYIAFATGVQSDIRNLPYLHTIQQEHPIEYIGGLPCLNDDLMWNDDVPLFVTGRFASLRLGPGAPNLVGARIGAERIAWNVDAILDKLEGSRKTDSKKYGRYGHGEDKMAAYAAGGGNRYDSLGGFGDKSS